MKNVTNRYLFDKNNIDKRLRISLAKREQYNGYVSVSVDDFQYEIDEDNEQLKVFIPIQGNVELLDMFEGKRGLEDELPRGIIGRYQFSDNPEPALIFVLEPDDNDNKDSILPFLRKEVAAFNKYLGPLNAKAKKHNKVDLLEIEVEEDSKKKRKEDFRNRFKK